MDGLKLRGVEYKVMLEKIVRKRQGNSYGNEKACLREVVAVVVQLVAQLLEEANIPKASNESVLDADFKVIILVTESPQEKGWIGSHPGIAKWTRGEDRVAGTACIEEKKMLRGVLQGD